MEPDIGASLTMGGRPEGPAGVCGSLRRRRSWNRMASPEQITDLLLQLVAATPMSPNDCTRRSTSSCDRSRIGTSARAGGPYPPDDRPGPRDLHQTGGSLPHRLAGPKSLLSSRVRRHASDPGGLRATASIPPTGRRHSSHVSRRRCARARARRAGPRLGRGPGAAVNRERAAEPGRRVPLFRWVDRGGNRRGAWASRPERCSAIG